VRSTDQGFRGRFASHMLLRERNST